MRFRNQSVGKPSYMGLSYFNPSLKWGKAWKKWNYGYIFLWHLVLGKHWHQITVSGLYFAKNRPETHFLRDFMIIWLSVELAGRAKIWGSHPQFRSSTPFSSREHASNTNISLNFTFPGFTLLENDQKRTFYVILWDYMGPLEIKTFAAKKFFFSKLQTDSSQSIIWFRRNPK